MLATADPDADLEVALADWRRFRQRKRTVDVHWIDVLYQAYLTGILSIVAVLVLSSMVGDDVASAEQVRQVLRHGPGWLGALAALAIAFGLRSGSRGGPLALERSEVRHVLLSPVDRTTALRGPALRQLRFLAFVGVVAGGITGELASKRLPGATLAWVGTGALAGLSLVALAVGMALVAAGARLPRWVASALGVALLGGALADGLQIAPGSPTAAVGDLLLWPLRFEAVGLVPPALAVAALVVGFSRLGHVSLEAAERRSSLVGQLRFAATLQDVRTVLVLRRQLAMELPRLRPWLPLPWRGTARWPVFTRGLHGLLRWPAARLARLLLLALVVGGSLRGVWAGTTPLLLIAGLALFVAGLDAVEPLAQEVDHPSRRDSTPWPASNLHLRHLPAALMSQLLVAAVASAVAASPGGEGRVPLAVAVVLALTLAMGGVGAAVVSVLSGPPSLSGGWSLAPPEAQGMQLAVRTAWPPLIATLGAVPVLLARTAAAADRSAVGGARLGAALMLSLFALICGWVRVRDDVRAWFRSRMEMIDGPT
ncbi:MAG: hypothetical protein ACSLFP_10560 [Acidimicrobiales bacterium]